MGPLSFSSYLQPQCAAIHTLIPSHTSSHPQPSSCSVLPPRHLIPSQAGLPNFSSESSASHLPRLSFQPLPQFLLQLSQHNSSPSQPQLPACSCPSAALPAGPTYISGPAQSVAPPLPSKAYTLREVNCHWLIPSQDSAPSASTSAIAADRRPSALSPGNGAGRFRGKSLDSPTGKRIQLVELER